MPAGRTTPPMTTSLAAMMFAVSRQVMNSAAQATKRHDMPPPLSDIRHDRRRLLAERALQRRRELRVVLVATREDAALSDLPDRKSTRLNSSHRCISYAVFCLKKKKKNNNYRLDNNR